MPSRSIPELVLEEAAEVLGELEDWLCFALACPKCGALQGGSHLARCPLGRVARLRCLLDLGGQQRRDEQLVALRRERGERGVLAGDGPLPAPLGSAVSLSSAALEPPLAPSAPTVAGEITVPTLAPTQAATARFPQRLRLRLLRRLLGLRAGQSCGGGRFAVASRGQRGGSVLVLHVVRRRGTPDEGPRSRRDARVMDPVPSLWRLVLRLLVLLVPRPCEGQRWPSLARLERVARIHRGSVLDILRRLNEHGLLDTRPAGKVGAL